MSPMANTTKMTAAAKIAFILIFSFSVCDFRLSLNSATLKRKSQLGAVTTFAPYFSLFLSIPHIDAS